RIQFTHTSGDLDLELLDANGRRISISESVTNSELVSLQGLPAGTYYVHAYGYAGSRNPHYSLRIQTQSPDHRLLSEPFTPSASYNFRYKLGTSDFSSTQS